MTRACGPCTECCYVLAVHELHKAPFVRCAHQSRGCDIYPNRPASCSGFRCLWLDTTVPHLTRKDRPDRVGIVFATGTMADGKTILVAYVRKPGADEKGRGMELVKLLATHLPVVIIGPKGKHRIAVSEDDARLLPALRDEFNYVGEVVDGKLQRRRLPVLE